MSAFGKAYCVHSFSRYHFLSCCAHRLGLSLTKEEVALSAAAEVLCYSSAHLMRTLHSRCCDSVLLYYKWINTNIIRSTVRLRRLFLS